MLEYLRWILPMIKKYAYIFFSNIVIFAIYAEALIHRNIVIALLMLLLVFIFDVSVAVFLQCKKKECK